MLSDSLGRRSDRGLTPSALGRNNIENFLNRLAYVESVGEISRYRRYGICQDVREVLAGIRALGTHQDECGRRRVWPGDFAIERGDIPAEPERGEPGRDLPPEIMAILCAKLGHPRTRRGAGCHPELWASTPDGGQRTFSSWSELPAPQQRRIRGARLRQRQG